MVDTVRYYLALVVVVTFPPAFGFWFIVHPFIGFWRRLGSRVTYAIMLPLLLVSCYGLFRFRATLLAVDYGTQWVLIGVGFALYALATVVELKCRRYLTLRTLMGVPELKAPEEGPGKLLDEGIYSRVRHPRYLGVILGGAGMALIANYQASYAMMAATVPVVYLLTLVEERELRARFGEQYVRYSERVPRIIPQMY